MTYKRAAALLRFGAIAIALPLFGASESAAQPSEVTTTQHFDFAPGGVIRIDGSYGILHVEAWDRPEVAITVTKSLPPGYGAQHPDKAAQRLDHVRIDAERRSSTELTLSTTKSSLNIEYEIQVPRNSRLEIHHRVGYVSVSGVTGDIDATCHRGDLLLWLPEKGAYSIDARSKVGTVQSDFAGSFGSRYLVARRFSRSDPSPSTRVYLRAGFGGITIKPVLSESEAPLAAGP